MFEMTKSQYEKWSMTRQRGALRYVLTRNLLISVLLGASFGVLWLVSSFSFRALLSYWYVVVTLCMVLFLYIAGALFALVSWLLSERQFKQYEIRTRPRK